MDESDLRSWKFTETDEGYACIEHQCGFQITTETTLADVLHEAESHRCTDPWDQRCYGPGPYDKCRGDIKCYRHGKNE